MKFIPDAVGRKIAYQSLITKKHSPTILLGTGIASLVGSTLLACRATLKLEGVLDQIENDKLSAEGAKGLVDSGAVEGTSYSDSEYKRDVAVISISGVGNVAKLYVPSVVLGGVGILCLTKSHKIMQDRNVALTAAYVAVDKAFTAYRERVVDRFGEEIDRDLRYDNEEVDIIDEQTGKVISNYRATHGEQGLYARWFDAESSKNFTSPPDSEWNLVFLRQQQNFANDLLRMRGHLMLNDVYTQLGLSHTSAGSVVGWVFDRDNPHGDNYIDFGCWDQMDGSLRDFNNGRDGAILLDFNVDGSIWDLLDERAKKS